MSTAPSHMTEDERIYLQDRMTLLGKAMLWLALLRFTMELDCYFGDRQTTPFYIYAFNPVMWFVYWRYIGRGDFPASRLYLLTFGALFSSLTTSNIAARLYLPGVISSIGLSSELQEVKTVIALVQAFFSMDMVLQAVVIVAMRAAIIPSARMRTVRDTLLLGIPVLVINTFGLGPWDPPSPFSKYNTPDVWWLTLIPAMIWWVIAVLVCSLISGIVYGLRREIREMKRLGPYTLEEKIGEGGMGVVFKANHALLRRSTAIKLISVDKAGATSLRRFEQEVRLTARLSHPNTVTVFDYGHTPDGLFYYAMELLDGADLEKVVKVAGALPCNRTLKILADLAGALEEAHGIGLIHRDIKPSNIILSSQGGRPDVAKLVDFGSVKELSGEAEAGLTHPEAVIGTPLYMAPETMRAPQDVGPAADIYSLGAVGYFLLTGTHVFDGGTVVEILGHHLHSTPAPISVRRGEPVPSDVEQVIARCLAKDPAQRPKNAAQLRDALLACTDYGTWSDADGRAWWKQHAQELKAKSVPVEPASPSRTLLAEDRQKWSRPEAISYE